MDALKRLGDDHATMTPPYPESGESSAEGRWEAAAPVASMPHPLATDLDMEAAVGRALPYLRLARPMFAEGTTDPDRIAEAMWDRIGKDEVGQAPLTLLVLD